jgi:hypothetical protein
MGAFSSYFCRGENSAVVNAPLLLLLKLMLVNQPNVTEDCFSVEITMFYS